MTEASSVTRRVRPGTSLASRLMIGQLIVLLAGALTIAVLTVLIGPAVFHFHLLQTDLPVDSSELVSHRCCERGLFRACESALPRVQTAPSSRVCTAATLHCSPAGLRSFQDF